MADKKKENNKKSKDELELMVLEAHHGEVGKGIVRIDSGSMKEIGIVSGEAVLIKGKGETVGIAWRSQGDGEKTIRMDGILRHNSGTSVGEKVVVKKGIIEEAKSVSLSPMQEVEFSGNPVPFFREKLLDKVLLKENEIAIDVMGTTLRYVVSNTNPKGIIKISNNTQLLVLDKVVKAKEKKQAVRYEDIGGLKEEIDQIREMVELPMKHPEIFERLGIGAPKGVLLTGPPGTGKTLLAKAVAAETDSNFYSIAGPEIISKFYGDSEKHLREIFEQAEKNSPSIIFIDEIDSIAPKREEVTGEVERRVVAQLLTSMDGLKGRGQVVVIAATNRPDSIDPALRRPGRFDREISLNVPDISGRKEILQIHTRGMPLSKDIDLDKLAEMTIGYTGADLEALAKESAMKALRNLLPEIKKFDEKKIPTQLLEKIEVNMQHFLDAFKKVEPSAMREVLIRKPTTKWTDIGGMQKVKQQLIEAIEWPLKEPGVFKKAGIKPAKGILLFGPSGCGKTLLAKAIANESQANFISVKGPELISKWVGESEKHVRELFKKARQVSPSIVFFDEFDAISQTRGSHLSDATERVVNQLLTELDGIEDLERVMVIAATNRPDLIDPGLLRPGRIDLQIEIPKPGKDERKEIFKVHSKEMPLAKGISFEEFSEEEFSGAEIEAVCREAGMNALREMKKEGKKEATITKKHFEKAIESLKEQAKKF